MGFFTKLPLSDLQTKQEVGDSLTLSGITNFAGSLKSKGIEIDATVTGTSITGHVLTYLAGKIKLAPSSGGDTTFDSNRTTTRSGIPTVTVGGSSVKQFLEGYFFPSVAPVLSITGGGTRMFGNNSSLTLNWSVRRKTLPLLTITVNGNLVTPTNLYTSLPAEGLITSGTSAIITSPNVNQTYQLVSTTASESVNASTTVMFYYKRYYFGDNQDLIGFTDSATSTVVNLFETPLNAEFATIKAKATFTLNFSNQHFYYVYPTSFGIPSFTINGLLNNDFSFKDFTFTNPYGYSTSFKLCKSNNLLNGSFNIAVA